MYLFVNLSSPTGNLLASQGNAPDFMLTIWDWRQEAVVLRTKAFSQDVFKVTFSKDLKGILTTSGTGHIKFVFFTLIFIADGNFVPFYLNFNYILPKFF